MRAVQHWAMTILCVAWGTSVLASSPVANDEALLIAHRGGVVDDQRIENSLPAVEEAIRRGYFMLEVDIRESKDGHPVVHHDPDFVRYYGDPRRVADLTWAEIQQLRSTPGNLRPIDFSEYAAACDGKIRLMLDVKGPDHDQEFFQQILSALQKHDLLKTAFAIGTDQAKELLTGRCKVAVNRDELARAIQQGEKVAEKYFLFEHGDMRAETIRMAQDQGVTVVPSVNVFHYPQADHSRLALRDIRRLRQRGVTYFQIDSVYEGFCREPSETVGLSRMPAAKAHQAVAVDAEHVYAIANKRIGKYSKVTGKPVKQWSASDELPLIHLNSGVVIDKKLYCAHSNYPKRPSTSSVEIWDAETLAHIGSHSFGIYEGSLTWIDRHEDAWWAVFAHYSKDMSSGEVKNNSWTSLVRFDNRWRRTGGWTFPASVLTRFGAYSCSGGAWGSDGYLYCSGHDRGELYRLKLPAAGAVLRLVDVIPSPFTGQGFAWDKSRTHGSWIYGIHRAKREVVLMELPPARP